MPLTDLILLITLGGLVGFFAGLLGIGGGAIMVPALTAYFLWQSFEPSVVVHMALATSMSCIVINALLSIKAHQRHQAIQWPLVLKLSPMVVVGSVLASLWVISLTSKTIALVFLILMSLVAVQMIVGFKPSSTTASDIKLIESSLVGFFIGLISATVAIGGGSLTVPYLHWHQVKLPQAIATAAAIGLPLALAGSLVFSIQGSKLTHLPEQTIGYIYWPATLLLSTGSLITTRIGANLTHQLPVKTLKVIFAILIIALAVQMYSHI